jgi:hypothetical protein
MISLRDFPEEKEASARSEPTAIKASAGPHRLAGIRRGRCAAAQASEPERIGIGHVFQRLGLERCDGARPVEPDIFIDCSGRTAWK